MEKAFHFVDSLSDLFIENLGQPTIKVYNDMVEVYFDTSNTIRDVSLLMVPGCDQFRMFPSVSDNAITIVYTFYR